MLSIRIRQIHLYIYIHVCDERERERDEVSTIKDMRKVANTNKRCKVESRSYLTQHNSPIPVVDMNTCKLIVTPGDYNYMYMHVYMTLIPFVHVHTHSQHKVN